MLRDLETTGALLEGHFELRSKLHSNRFFQCALLQRHPRVFARLCAALAEQVTAAKLGRLDAVIAPAIGGIVAGHELARALDLLSVFAEKQDGVLAMRRFQIEAGARYLVAEDVITRGGRVQETIDLVRAGGGEVAAVAVLIDRSDGAADFGVPLLSLLRMAPEVWQPSECPLCKKGLPCVHPGS
ncbi:MAG: orotate phosphoribosyltransferase [Kiritimatiellae bacterium]|nr:orotate phosphoribosyltransferase [Kiritimatiellia bacterium]